MKSGKTKPNWHISSPHGVSYLWEKVELTPKLMLISAILVFCSVAENECNGGSNKWCSGRNLPADAGDSKMSEFNPG